MCKISVIVPVYNVEKYLDKSIRSLVEQTIFDELEIIFVNDGSTDASSKIIKNYINQYSNMRLIEQTNKGVSVARNKGIEAAVGDYVAFFDADDIAQSSLYEKLLSLMVSNDADLSCINYSMCFDDGVTKIHKPKEKRILCDDEIVKSFLLSNVLCNNIFDKLFKLSIVREIAFPEGYAIGEDMFFVFQYLLMISKVAVDTTESLYLYNIRSGSAMKSEFNEKYFDAVVLAEQMMDMFPLNSSLQLYAEANWIHECCKALAIYYQSGSAEFKKTIQIYEKNINSYSIRKAYKYLSKKHFVALLIMRLSPQIYRELYRKLRIG